MKPLLTCCYLLLALRLFAQEGADMLVQLPGRYDSNYVRSLTHYLTPRLFFQGKSQGITMQTPGRSYNQVQYSPNVPVNIGAGIYYKWFGLAYGIRFPFAIDQTDKYGSTRALDVQLNIYTRRFAIDVYLQEYFGFHMNNPAQVFPGYNTAGPYPQRSDINSLSLGANFIWIFNHQRFSYRAAFIQTERQRRSAGSWLLGPTIGYYRLRADSALVPNDPGVPNPPREQYMQRGEFYSVGGMGGYSYNAVWGRGRRWFFSPTALLGFTYGDVQVVTANEQIPNRSTLNARLNLRGAIGFNGDRYYWGFTTVADIYSITFAKNFNFTYNIANYYLFFGRRFDVSRRVAE